MSTSHSSTRRRLTWAPPDAARWTILAMLMAYAFACHFNRVSMSVAGSERLMDEFGISETRMGWVYSAYLILYTVCMTPGGWFTDRFGPKVALIAMGFGSAAFVALTGSVGLLGISALVWPAFMALRGMAGSFSAPIHPAGARVVSRWFPVTMLAMGNGLITAAALVGIASSYYVFGSMMDRFGWPAAFGVAGIATAAIAVVWTWYASDDLASHRSNRGSTRSAAARVEREARHNTAPSGEEGRAEGFADGALPTPSCVPDAAAEPWFTLLRDRSLVLLTISYAAVGYFEYLFFYWMQYYFDTVLGLGTSRSRLYSTIVMLTMAVGMYAGGHLADQIGLKFGRRAGRAMVPVLGMILSAVFLVLGIFTRQPLLVLVWFAIALACVGASEGPFWTTAVELGRARGGTSAGIFNTGGNAGGLLAPIVTPLFSSYFGWQGGLALASVFCLLGAGLWFWIEPAREETPRLV